MDTAEKSRGHLKPNHIREPMVAGLFYPALAHELDARIISLLDGVDSSSGHCSAIVSPHGSLEYSGSIEARAWKAASARDVGTLVILSPSHRNFEEGIFIPELHHFALPTATFSVDRALAKELVHSSTQLHFDDIPFLEEHSIEMQLIFAARLFPSAIILPIIVSSCEEPALDSLLANLQFTLGDRIASTLFVLTSNLAVDDNPDLCLSSSAGILEAIERRDIEALRHFYQNPSSFCGGRIVAAYLRSSLSSGMDAHILGMGSSAALAEPSDPVVGYGAVAFSR